MITTFGPAPLGQRDRGAAPSEASPTTRMCGARESERRSPSRTTSWSSTIRQVISLGTREMIVSRQEPDYSESASCSGSAGGSRRTRRRSRIPCSRASRATALAAGSVSAFGRYARPFA